MINVICVKWGTKYGPDYVNRLRKMVEANLTLPFEFYCYTDDPEGVDANIIMMPDDGLELWWPKLRLFEEGKFKGKCLFFDLDMVIQDNVDCLLDFEGFHLIRSFWKNGKVTTYEPGMMQNKAWNMDVNSSCMVWEGDENKHIWEYFWDNPEYYMNKYEGIDRFMYHEGLINETFPKGIFYSRLHGAIETDETKLEPPWYYLPDHKVCMLNGMHKLTPEHFEWAKPYAGLEQYYI